MKPINIEKIWQNAKKEKAFFKYFVLKVKYKTIP